MNELEEELQERRNNRANSTATTPVVWFIRENGETLTVPKHMVYPIMTMPQGDGMIATINGLGFMISLQGRNLMPLIEDLANGRISHVRQSDFQDDSTPSAPIIRGMTWQAYSSVN